MAPPRIVEAFDVVDNIGAGFISCAIHFAGGAFSLQRLEEAFRRRVVPDIACSAPRACDAVVRQQALKLLARILGSLIGVMKESVSFSSAPDRHHQRIHDHWEGLQAFLTDGRTEIDSNRVGNLIRPITHSQNALFAGYN